MSPRVYDRVKRRDFMTLTTCCFPSRAARIAVRERLGHQPGGEGYAKVFRSRNGPRVHVAMRELW